MLYQIDRRIDSYGSCLNNKDEVAEDSNSFYETMGKYKFVLVLESSVCHEFIGRRLWQALHVGAVPVYFGADGVDAWMPNHPSVVHVSAYRDLKLLADHLKMLHRNRDQYQSLLKHKPTYNDNYFALITNNHLLSANLNAKYAELFECLVCERIGKNEKITKLGFKGYPYHPPEDKLSCPGPRSIASSLGLKVRKETGPFHRKWIRSKYESDAIRKMDNFRRNISLSELESDVVRMGREDRRPMDQFLN